MNDDFQYILLIILLLAFVVTVLIKPQPSNSNVCRKTHQEDLKEIERLTIENSRLREIVEKREEEEVCDEPNYIKL